MGLSGWLLSLYKWERLSDHNLVEMLFRVRKGMDQQLMINPDHKDLGKMFQAEEEIMAEMDKRGISYEKR